MSKTDIKFENYLKKEQAYKLVDKEKEAKELHDKGRKKGACSKEEMVYQWAKDAPKPGTAEKYVEDQIFQKNFISDFAKTFNGKFKNLKYTDVDFTQAYKLVDDDKRLKAKGNWKLYG